MCFAIRRGQVARRLDHYYYLPEFEIAVARLSAGKFSPVELKDVASQITDGTHFTPAYVDDGIRFVSAKDVKEFEISFDVRKFVSDAEHDIFVGRCNPTPGDILLSKIGTIGRAAVVPPDAPVFDLFVSVCLIKPKLDSIRPDYLCAVLNADFARAQFSRALKGIGVPDLHLEDIRRTLIPLPPPPKQAELVDLLNAARTIRQRKLEEAESLFGALDDFVLDALGLTLPPPDGHRTTYAVRMRDVHAAKKLYPNYFHPERLNAIRAVERKYKGDRCATLLSVADFRRDQRQVQPDDPYLGLANVQSNTGERIDSTEEDGEGTVFEYAENDVLFARLRPYLNKVYRAESGGVCSPEFHVMRVRPGPDGRPRVIPDYLAAVLRSGLVLSQTRHMMTGNTHPRLANDDVVNLVVPVPDAAMQKKIAAEVSRRRESARRLREDAARLWDDAKRRFEEELLGPEPQSPKGGALSDGLLRTSARLPPRRVPSSPQRGDGL